MLVNRASETAFKATFDSVNRYLAHWFSLVENGVDASGVSGGQIAARDAGHRAVIFNPAVDKVWNQITPLLGADTVQTIIGLLRGQPA